MEILNLPQSLLNTALTGFLYFISKVDSLDWKELGADHEINHVLNHKHLGNGSIILFHNDAKYTPDVLETIIKGLRDKGYEIVPIGQLIHKENYYIDHEGRQIPSSENTTEQTSAAQ